jgi:hypothetical protein
MVISLIFLVGMVSVGCASKKGCISFYCCNRDGGKEKMVISGASNWVSHKNTNKRKTSDDFRFITNNWHNGF